MNVSGSSKQHINFGARCVQVRDADWVCRTINHKFPHFSSTKYTPIIDKYLKKHGDIIKYKGDFQKFSELTDFLDLIQFPEGYQKLMDTIFAIKKMIKNFAYKRVEADDRVGMGNKHDYLVESMYMMENFKLGNCTENAVLAELVLKLNGLKNACCATLHKGFKGDDKLESLDHFVCVVNTDRTAFDGKITPKTIIVDPWLGKADFARNMERYYRNECSGFFGLNSDEVFKYKIYEFVDLPESSLDAIRKTYPELVSKKTSEEFMR